jgi:transcriptional regulator with XRE-family HTH domain
MPDTPPRLTNVEVAYVLGVSEATVSRVRRGERGVSVMTLMKIAEAYDLDPQELLSAHRAYKAGNPRPWVSLLETALGASTIQPNTTF